MAKRKDVTPVIYIEVTEDSTRWDTTRYGHINCQVLVIDHEDDRGHPVNPSDYLGARFDNIVIDSQMDSSTARGYRDNSDGTTYPTERTYGWKIGVRTYSTLPLRQMEQVIKTLRKMDRAVSGQDFVHYADYVVAAGQAIGAKFAFVYSKRSGSYADWDWEFLTAEGARAWINREEEKLARKLMGEDAA